MPGGRALLQEELGRLHARIGVEALHHAWPSRTLAMAVSVMPW